MERMTAMARYSMLELRKNRRALLGTVLVFLASLPLEALVLGRAGMEFAQGIGAALMLWVTAGSAGLAVLFGASAGAGLRSGPTNDSEALLPVSAQGRVWGALLVSLLQVLLLLSIFVLTSILLSPLSWIIEWELVLLLAYPVNPIILLTYILYAHIASFTCAYAVRHGLLGGLLGMMLSGMLIMVTVVLPWALDPLADIGSFLWLLYLILEHFPSYPITILITALCGSAAALFLLIPWGERKARCGPLRVCAVVIGLLLGSGWGLSTTLSAREKAADNFSQDAARIELYSQKALDELDATTDDMKRFDMLPRASRVALGLGETDKARDYATELLELAPRYEGDWNYGNAVHHGNLILGRIAVRSGDLEEAKRRLLAAGRTPGSPQLDSFGPDMALASDLIKRGERTAVLEYFELCGRFWRMDNGRLSKWSEVVKDGGRPDFGANMDY